MKNIFNDIISRLDIPENLKIKFKLNTNKTLKIKKRASKNFKKIVKILTYIYLES